MKRMWAPWRTQYIASLSAPAKGACIFCAKPRARADEKNLVLYRAKRCFVIMNAYPYNPGHLMVVPYAHRDDLAKLDPATVMELGLVSQHCIRILRRVMHAEGFNWGANIGPAAGAGVKHHVHVHVVPRWNGDANFMPVLGEVKVLSESLEDTYRKLRKEFQRLS
jgi:ATP adenylyltransferase